MLVPLEELAREHGRGGAAAEERTSGPEARVRRVAREEPSLPFSGFSVLALVLTGAAATSAGRRLHLATAPPAGTEHVKPRVAEPPRVARAGAAALAQPRAAGGPRPLLLGIALLGVAALAATPRGRSLLRPRPGGS